MTTLYKQSNNNRPIDMRKSMIQLAEQEVINGKKVSVRAKGYASRAGKVVSNLANTLTNVISKASEENKELSTNELVEFITKDPVFWKKFRKFVADENVFTDMGTLACLEKFLTEKMDEIKESYVIHKAEKSSEKKASLGEKVQRRRNSAFSSGQRTARKESTTMTSTKSELSFFRYRCGSQPIHDQQNATWSECNSHSVKPKATTGVGMKTSASALLLGKLSFAPAQNGTMTSIKSDLYQTNNKRNYEKKNATWSELDVHVHPRDLTHTESAASSLPSVSALKLSSSFNTINAALGHKSSGERFKVMDT